MVTWQQRGSPTDHLRPLLIPTPDAPPDAPPAAPPAPPDDLPDDLSALAADLAPTLLRVPGLPRRRRRSPATLRHDATHVTPVSGEQAQVLADFAAFMLCRRPEQLLTAALVERIPPRELAVIHRLLCSVYTPALALAGRLPSVAALLT